VAEQVFVSQEGLFLWTALQPRRLCSSFTLFCDVLPGVIPNIPAENPALVYVSPRGPVVRGDCVAGDATMLPSS
jgi:hypothetical protein